MNDTQCTALVEATKSSPITSKWPAVVISGKPVTRDQALDIIVRTDTFTDDVTSPYHGNDRDWLHQVHTSLGLGRLAKAAALNTCTPEAEVARDYTYKLREDIRRGLGHLRLAADGLANARVVSSYIWGRHGWCDFDGQISGVTNVGKWPDNQSVIDELLKITDAFPYLEFAATVFNEVDDHDDPTLNPVEQVYGTPAFTFWRARGQSPQVSAYNGAHDEARFELWKSHHYLVNPALPVPFNLDEATPDLVVRRLMTREMEHDISLPDLIAVLDRVKAALTPEMLARANELAQAALSGKP